MQWLVRLPDGFGFGIVCTEWVASWAMQLAAERGWLNHYVFEVLCTLSDGLVWFVWDGLYGVGRLLGNAATGAAERGCLNHMCPKSYARCLMARGGLLWDCLCGVGRLLGNAASC